jgi:3-phenylpropionate/trans-cinnamate dioxygenase ferredoxin reductase subunit
MAAERIVIVGAGPVGLSTTRSYRESGGRGAVALVGEEPLLPHERPPLTKEFLRGELGQDGLPIERAEWFERHGVDLHLGVHVAAILAAGDVALAHNVAAGRAIRVEHWGDALGHGKVAGRTLAAVQLAGDEVLGSGRRSAGAP